MGGATGRKKFLKIFKKGVKNPKIGVPEVPGGGVGAPYIGCAGRSLGAICMPGGQASSSVTRGAFRAGISTTDTHLRSKRFTPLIYRGHVCKLHWAPYRWHLRLSDP